MNALSQQERKNALLATMRGQMPEDDGESGAYKVSRFMDAINRGLLVGTAGAPADIAAWFMRQLGDKVENPVGGSEWIGQKMQDMGMVTANRDPLTETIASFANPVTAMGSLYKLFKAAPAIAGIFAGKNAKLADLLKLQEAEQMLARGDNAADVWRATGWGKGPDGHWRFEIPDNEASGVFTHLKEFGPDRLSGKAVQHPLVYDAYSGINDITQLGLRSDTPGGRFEQMGGVGGMITAKAPNEQGLSRVGVHELQHAIQEREGFARGGSPSSPYEGNQRTDFARMLYEEMRANPANAADSDEAIFNHALKVADSDMGREKAYKRLAGEAEARLTQSRIPLTQDERLAQYPWDAEYFQQATGVPVNKLIYRYDGGPAASVGDYRGEHVAPMKDSGAPLHDLTGGGSIYPADVYSTKAAQYYGDGNPLMDRQSFAVAHSVKGNPNAKVTMFRAVPKEITPMEELAALEKHMNQYLKRDRVPKEAQNGLEGSAWFNDAYERRAKLEALIESYQPKDSINSINNGDWVTINRQYAKDHGESALNGKYKIISKKVPARKLYTNGDSIHEWGYDESGFIDPRLLLGLGAGAGAGLYYGGKDE